MPSRASLWTRITYRADMLVRKVPLPARLQRLMSALVYRNPPMSAVRAADTMRALEADGLETWVMGGWGIDALAGKHNRSHSDLDLIVDLKDLDLVLAVLRRLGYEEWDRREPTEPIGEIELNGPTVVVRDGGMHEVDVHTGAVRESGMIFTTGTIGGLRVRCLTPEQQLAAQVESRSRSRVPSERRRYRSNVEIARRLSYRPRGSRFGRRSSS